MLPWILLWLAILRNITAFKSHYMVRLAHNAMEESMRTGGSVPHNIV